MLKIRINKNTTIDLKQENGQTIIDGKPVSIDIKSLDNNRFHILNNNKSFNAELIKFDLQTKKIQIKVNQELFEIEIKEKLDILLEAMGMDTSKELKIEDIKAPMPGLIIDIKVEKGQAIEQGDPIIILEAMKMENIVKSPQKGIIKSIQVKKGQTVEKNQILIRF